MTQSGEYQPAALAAQAIRHAERRHVAGGGPVVRRRRRVHDLGQRNDDRRLIATTLAVRAGRPAAVRRGRRPDRRHRRHQRPARRRRRFRFATAPRWSGRNRPAPRRAAQRPCVEATTTAQESGRAGRAGQHQQARDHRPSPQDHRRARARTCATSSSGPPPPAAARTARSATGCRQARAASISRRWPGRGPGVHRADSQGTRQLGRRAHAGPGLATWATTASCSASCSHCSSARR